MNTSKAWYLSKGVWGSVAVLLATGLQLAGYSVNLEELNTFLDQVLNVVSGVLTAVGGGVSLWGRIVASKKIQ